MTAQAKSVIENRQETRWQTIKRWLTAIDEGLNYDPNEYTYDKIRQLLQEVKELEIRVAQIEDKNLQHEQGS